jgi:hypothetical protein
MTAMDIRGGDVAVVDAAWMPRLYTATVKAGRKCTPLRRLKMHPRVGLAAGGAEVSP